MKLVIAVIQDYDTDSFLRALSRNNLMATRVASAGGFLRSGNTTVFVGVDDDQVPLVKRLLMEHCRIRADQSDAGDLVFLDDSEAEHICASKIGGGIAFVARVDQFHKLSRTASSVQPEEAR